MLSDDSLLPIEFRGRSIDHHDPTSPDSSFHSSASAATASTRFGCGVNPLDSFFPFDPCLLVAVHQRVECWYRVWKGLPGVDVDIEEGSEGVGGVVDEEVVGAEVDVDEDGMYKGSSGSSSGTSSVISDRGGEVGPASMASSLAHSYSAADMAYGISFESKADSAQASGIQHY